MLRLDLVIASDGPQAMAGEMGDAYLRIDTRRPDWSAGRIVKLTPPPAAVVAADDQGIVIAAEAAKRLGLRHNPVDAVVATRNKLEMRRRLAAAGIAQPRFAAAGPGELTDACREVGFPSVVKPISLAASRGVIRVDDAGEAKAAENRIRGIVASSGNDPSAPLLAESYLAGVEVAVEGLLYDGQLEALAVLDKPDPLEGPYFEETLFVTPSRHAVELQERVTDLVGEAVLALGLGQGPIHGEVRIDESETPFLIEVAARSIGGLCGRSLAFGLLGESLETIILRNALGFPSHDLEQARPSSGVMMLPIPQPGTLAAVDGIEDALAVTGITEFELTIPIGREVVPLPEGDRYLGFLFAEGVDPAEVEQSLRLGSAQLRIVVT